MLPQKDMTVFKKTGTWVQVDRKACELFSKLAITKPAAASLMMTMIANMGRSNALVISQQALSNMLGCHITTVKRNLKFLRDNNWIEIRDVGSGKGVRAYIINDRLAWQGKREGLRYSLFSANVMLSEKEQSESITNTEPLKQIPTLFKDEHQLPTGEGLEPPSQPFLEGLEGDLPVRNFDPETGEILE